MPNVGERYDLLDVIGQGSARIVHLAYDRVDRTYVAAKVLRSPAQDELAQLRFLSEQVTAVSHPNVIRHLDWYQAPGVAVLITDLATHGSLDDIAAQGDSVSPDFVLGAARDRLAGLDHIHAVGMLHRDIKPANVFVERDSESVVAKLGDLGTAIVANRPRLTQELSAVGTAGFVAPEILEGAPHDELTDIWSLGATLSALAVRCDRPVPDALSKLIGRMVGERANRPRSAAAALAELPPPTAAPVDAATTNHIVEAVARHRRRRRWSRVRWVVLLPAIVFGTRFATWSEIDTFELASVFALLSGAGLAAAAAVLAIQSLSAATYRLWRCRDEQVAVRERLRRSLASTDPWRTELVRLAPIQALDFVRQRWAVGAFVGSTVISIYSIVWSSAFFTDMSTAVEIGALAAAAAGAFAEAARAGLIGKLGEILGLGRRAHAQT